MATLSEDSDSWKAGGVIRRDFRSVRNGPETPKRGGTRRKKDTKRWCRGKVGKEHDIEHQIHPTYGDWGVHVDRCKMCGKETSTYGWSWKLRQGQRPVKPGCCNRPIQVVE